eukprot:1092234-Pleurochrysis_carterae.AAC.1
MRGRLAEPTQSTRLVHGTLRGSPASLETGGNGAVSGAVSGAVNGGVNTAVKRGCMHRRRMPRRSKCIG